MTWENEIKKQQSATFSFKTTVKDVRVKRPYGSTHEGRSKEYEEYAVDSIDLDWNVHITQQDKGEEGELQLTYNPVIPLFIETKKGKMELKDSRETYYETNIRTGGRLAQGDRYSNEGDVNLYLHPKPIRIELVVEYNDYSKWLALYDARFYFEEKR